MDDDDDGQGLLSGVVTSCEDPSTGDDTYVLNSDDCDDAADTVYDGASELCDGQLNDCSGTLSADESDGDGDLYVVCSSWVGASTTILGGDDCDDTDINEFPGQQWYLDGDRDGYGTNATVITQCEDPSTGAITYVLNDDDCNDSEAAAYDGATELCDGIDNDCLNGIDDNVVYSNYYADLDGDGQGDINDASPTNDCVPPVDTAANNTDCDDTDDTVYDGATELCDGQLNDCSGTLSADETDPDSDLYVACSSWVGPTGTILGGGDCDNTATGGASTPGGTEVCDAIDNDCLDGVPADEADDDSDHYVECTPWVGSSATLFGGNDCNDGNDTVCPDAGLCPEVCDGLDNVCDSVTPADEVDTDTDGYLECSNYVGDSTFDGGDDCAPSDGAINPGAAEACDGADTDCDSATDELISADADSYSVCGPDNTADTGDEDCDDTDASVNPGVTENDTEGNRSDGVDNDCDGATDEYAFGEIFTSVVSSNCGCHSGSSHSTGFAFNNSQTTLYDKWVGGPGTGVASSEVPTVDRIEPGDSTQSYVMHKLDGTQTSVGGFGSQMPASAGCCLSLDVRDGIRAWINSGAPND